MRRYRSSSQHVLERSGPRRRGALAAWRRVPRARRRDRPTRRWSRSCRTSRSRTSPSPRASHLSSASSRPAQSGVHEAAEEPQLAPEPPRRRAQSVHPLDVALAHARLVRPDPVEPPVERLPDDEAGGITGAIARDATRAHPGPRLRDTVVISLMRHALILRGELPLLSSLASKILRGYRAREGGPSSPRESSAKPAPPDDLSRGRSSSQAVGRSDDRRILRLDDGRRLALASG